MNGRLSNSVLLHQIIPQVKSSIDTNEEETPVCMTRIVQPAELIAIEPKQTEKKSKINQDLLDKLNKLRETAEFDTIINGSKLGLSAYQKPLNGIPVKDLSRELQIFIQNVEEFINKPDPTPLCFGQVRYDPITKRFNFYSPEDYSLQNILGTIDLNKISPNIVVDQVLDSKSFHAISNSAVAKSIQQLRTLIPKITVIGEILNIENT